MPKESKDMKASASVGGRPITLDPLLPVEPLGIHPKRVESSIPCGLRLEWLSGDDGHGTSFDLSAGAGCGSPYLTLSVKMPDGTTREEIVDIRDVAKVWIDRVVTGEATPIPEGETP